MHWVKQKKIKLNKKIPPTEGTTTSLSPDVNSGLIVTNVPLWLVVGEAVQAGGGV